MGGCRCSFRDCPNTTRTENIHFFHYPVKQKDRCRQWIENAKKPQFCDLEEDQLRNKVICDQHFEEKWFPNPQKKRLLQGAIPTLPGKYLENISPEKITSLGNHMETTPFVSHDVDIQVLPANDEGTVFILDTEAMFTKSQKIESYIYQNGAVVPSSLVSSTSTSFNSSPKSPRSKIIRDQKVEQAKHIFGFEKSTNSHEVLVKNEYSDYSDIISESDMPSIQEENFEIVPKRVATEEVVLREKDIQNSNLNKTYLQKIKQHGKDIASIKKLLKEKLTETKPNTNGILSVLREQLPPSLFTVVALNLNEECELTEDDVDFFTIIHRMSPDVYQLLIEKFKWNLPCVDVVENIE